MRANCKADVADMFPIGIRATVRGRRAIVRGHPSRQATAIGDQSFIWAEFGFSLLEWEGTDDRTPVQQALIDSTFGLG
jgi:hypothetical protein